MIEFQLTHIPLADIALRLVAAAALAAVIGLDRELLARSAGLRTHMLVSLASATFTIAAWEIMHQATESGDKVQMDAVRIIEAITAGVAFLAAGAIIQSRGQVQGLTTGAGMWMAGAIGLICGLGLYTFAIVATAISFIIMTVLRWLENGPNPRKD